MAFVKGAVWGLVVGGIGAASASLIAPQPAGNVPPAPPLIASPATEPIVAPDVPEPMVIAVPAPQDIDVPHVAAEPAMTAPEDGTAVPVADTAPAEQPLAAIVDGTLTTPDTADAPDLTATADTPVLPNPQSRAPQIPETEQDVVVATAPAAPLIVADPVLPDDTMTAVIVVTDEPVSALVPDDVTQALPDEPLVVTPDISTQVETILKETVVSLDPADVVSEVTPEPDPVPDDAAEVTLPAVQDTAPAPATAPAEEDIIVLPQEDSTEPAPPTVVSIIDAEPRGLPGAGRSVIVDRTADATPEVAPEAPEVMADDRRPALVRYAAFFDNPEGKPLMSVMLIDDGTLAGGPRALEEIPFPVTVLLDPAQSGAADRMADWRKAGFEVASLAALPDGAAPTDVAVALEATFDALPDTIALVDIGIGGLQSGSGTAAQVIDNLSVSGRGLVLPEGGLNSALRVAESRDVPAATIFRDLDSSGQDARVIRRFVDQAAFRARQQPGVILLGRVRPETISALILWGTANRAGQVALAPLSATLLAK